MRHRLPKLQAAYLFMAMILFTFKAQAAMTPSIQWPGVCGVPLNPPTLFDALPTEVEGELKQENRNVVQRAVDLFSWQTFIALNRPVAEEAVGVISEGPGPVEPRGTGSTVQGEGTGLQSMIVEQRLWETWKEEFEVYLPQGQRPAPWGKRGAYHAQSGVRASDRVLFRGNKIDDVVDSTVQAAQTVSSDIFPPTLKDQNGNLVRYEIRMNKTVFDYIFDNKLYDSRNHVNFGTVNFPVGSRLIKAAWREITQEEASRYLTTVALICEKKRDTAELRNCRQEPTLMGLVGMHIMTKTPVLPSGSGQRLSTLITHRQGCTSRRDGHGHFTIQTLKTLRINKPNQAFPTKWFVLFRFLPRTQTAKTRFESRRTFAT